MYKVGDVYFLLFLVFMYDLKCILLKLACYNDPFAVVFIAIFWPTLNGVLA